MLTIQPPTIESVKGEHVRLTARFSLDGADNALFFSVPAQWGDALVAARLDAFLIGLLPLAMRRGTDIRLRAPISKRLALSVRRDLIPLLAVLDDRRQEIAIHCEAGVTEDGADPAPEGVGLGFSGGVDSFFSLASLLDTDDPVPHRLRPTHLVFCNAGSQGEWDQATESRLFGEREDRLSRAAAAVGLPLVPIDSNLSEILQLNFVRTHTIRNAAAVLAAANLFRTFVYSATYSYRRITAAPTRGFKDMAHADPILLPMLATETLDFAHVGTASPRFTKVQRLVTYRPTHAHLYVCTGKTGLGPNCGQCEKCVSTLFSIEALGSLENYGRAFDLPRYGAVRDRFLARHVFSQPGEVVYREILDVAAENGIRYPLATKMAGRLLGLVRKPLVTLRRKLRGHTSRDP